MPHTRPATTTSLALLACLAAACGERAAPAAPRQPTPEETLRERIRRDPTDVEARLALAHHLFDTGRRPDAIPYYAAVLEQRPGDPNIRTDFATSLFAAGRTAEARAEYERVTREHPEHLGATFNLAVLERAEGNHAAAASLWERAATLTDDARVQAQARELAAQARQQADPGGNR